MRTDIFDELAVGMKVKARDKTYPHSDPYSEVKHSGILYINRIDKDRNPYRYVVGRVQFDGGNYFRAEDLEPI